MARQVKGAGHPICGTGERLMGEELATPKHESPCRGGFKTRPYSYCVKWH